MVCINLNTVNSTLTIHVNVNTGCLSTFLPQINKIIPSHHPQIYSYQHQLEEDHITADKLAVSNIRNIYSLCFVCVNINRIPETDNFLGLVILKR